MSLREEGVEEVGVITSLGVGEGILMLHWKSPPPKCTASVFFSRLETPSKALEKQKKTFCLSELESLPFARPSGGAQKGLQISKQASESYFAGSFRWTIRGPKLGVYPKSGLTR